MKRYEKMGIDPTTKEGFKKAMNICPRKVYKDFPCGDKLNCKNCTVDYLFENINVKKVKRWETYNGNFMRAANDFKKILFVEPIAASYTTLYERFADWLMEEIEVEVEEESEDGFGLLM